MYMYIKTNICGLKKLGIICHFVFALSHHEC